jgi:hypothetical protein
LQHRTIKCKQWGRNKKGRKKFIQKNETWTAYMLMGAGTGVESVSIERKKLRPKKSHRFRRQTSFFHK